MPAATIGRFPHHQNIFDVANVVIIFSNLSNK
jgi:hypothetical protein